MPAALPEPVLAQAEQFLRDGWTIPAIADALGCAPATVRRNLRRRGHTIPDGRATASGGVPRTFTAAELEQAATAYQAGANVQTVARLLHTGNRQATEVLRSAGVTIRPPANHRGADHA